jgi:hypothetical protein
MNSRFQPGKVQGLALYVKEIIACDVSLPVNFLDTPAGSPYSCSEKPSSYHVVVMGTVEAG